MPVFPTGKKRAGRIDLHYPGRIAGPARTRWRLTILAVVLTMGYVASALLFPTWGEAHFAHGPVSAGHASWERQCQVCHEPFTPIRADAWGANWLLMGNFSSSSGEAAAANLPEQAASKWGQVTDQKCQACHAAAAHHPDRMRAGHEHSCASCHREHQGRGADLLQTTDRSCLRCHDRLDGHRSLSAERSTAVSTKMATTKAQGDAIAAHIGSFAVDHPEFRSLGSDPGRLRRFSHQQHLAAGIVVTGSRASPLLWRDVVPTGAVQRPAGVPLTDRVQLECRTCHQPDDRWSAAVEEVPGNGELMRPVSYERHCQACHARDLPDALPHGVTPAQIDQYLTAKFWDDQLQGGALSRVELPRRPIPGGSSSPELLTSQESLAAALQTGRARVREACGACHEIEMAGPMSAMRVVPPRLPAKWLRSGEFTHAAHIGQECAACHAAAPQSTQPGDVLIAGRAKCAECHRQSEGWSETGTARDDCTACHRYHTDPLPAEVQERHRARRKVADVMGSADRVKRRPRGIEQD